MRLYPVKCLFGAAIAALCSVCAQNAGAYTAPVANEYGSTPPTARVVVVDPIVTPPSAVDPTFHTPLVGGPTAVSILSDGKLIVAGAVTSGNAPASGVMRLNHDGSVDPTFQFTPATNIRSIKPLPDGRMLVEADKTVIRLLADGSKDPTFNPAPAVRSTDAPLPDGRFIDIALENNVATFTRVASDGSIDGTYSPILLTLASPYFSASDPLYGSVVCTPAGGGKTLVAFVSTVFGGTGVFSKNEATFVRLLSDGTLDPTFAMRSNPDAVRQLIAVGDRFMFVASSYAGMYAQMTIGRLDANAAPDPSYPLVKTGGIVLPVATLLSDGSAIVATPSINSPYRIIFTRYDSGGNLDHDFVAKVTPVSGSLNYTVPLAAPTAAEVYLAQTYQTVDGIATGPLIRILPRQHLSATRLTNFSALLPPSSDSTPLVGFMTRGTGTLSLLLRAVGPTLASFGLKSAAADPSLTAWQSNSRLVLSNDDWSVGNDVAALRTTMAAAGAFPLTDGSKDAALTEAFGAGVYLAQADVSHGSGTVLIEAYTTNGAPERSTDTRVINFSALASVGSGATLTGGFAITGSDNKCVLIRVVGPTLANYGVRNPLHNAVLTIRRRDTVIGWTNGSTRSNQYDAFRAATAAATFQTNSGSEPSLVLSLPEGAYTAEVSNSSDTAGTALLEVYELPADYDPNG